MREAVQRIRADLAVFAPALVAASIAHVKSELRWLSAALDAVRDAEMLRERLRRTAGLDPLAPLDAPSIARVDADLTARHEEALRVLDELLDSGRYVDLVTDMSQKAASPPTVKLADRKSSTTMPRLVARVVSRLTLGGREGIGARDLNPRGGDAQWQTVRKRTRVARYAAEAAAPIAGSPAAHLAHALADVQDVLDAHRDAVYSAETWLSISASDPDDHALAVTAGRLTERERTQVRQTRRAYPDAWRAADRGRLTGWLR
jgi:CHAD domain-containing protein